MLQPSTPRDYALAHLCRLEALWSAVHDGEVDAVHDARVATRRVRAALPFVFAAPPPVADEMRRIGRVLGRVRELDATDALLTTLEPRAPDAAVAIAAARREVMDRLMRQRRQLVKKLRHRPRLIAHVMTSGHSVARFSSLWRSWRHELTDAIHQRATSVQSAVDRSTAVFMPNRAHAARIALKKLRYLVELGLATGVMNGTKVLGDLKQAQESLGDLHDMIVLGHLIDEVECPAGAATESAALAAIVRAEIARLHEQYVRRRDEIRATCDNCLRSIDRDDVGPLAVPAAAVLAVPVLAAWYVRRRYEDDRLRATPAIAGPSARNQTATTASKIMQPNDEVGMKGQIGFPQK